MKIAVVYWSGSGNTQTMALAVAEGIKSKGAEAVLMQADEFDPATIADYDAIALGCPAMGAEVLEESVFQPMFDAALPLLEGKKTALFGSYGWGSGAWMEDWAATCREAGVDLVSDGLICQDMPDDDGVNACMELGASLV